MGDPSQMTSTLPGILRSTTRNTTRSTTTTKQSLDEYKQQVDQIRAFLQIVGLLALLIGGVGIANTMQVTLRRRRIEIAMLKTSGYRQQDLSALFALEAGW